MIKGRSALESLTMFGLANDGPLNVGGLGSKPAPQIPGVTTADKLVATPKPVKAKERKSVTKDTVTPQKTVTEVTPDGNAVTRPLTPAEKQKAYRLRKAALKGTA